MAVIPPNNLKHLKKNLSPSGVHKDMMHYMVKVKPMVFRCFLFLSFLLFFYFNVPDTNLGLYL